MIIHTGPVKESDATPYKLWTVDWTVTYISHLKIFGIVSYVHMPKPKRQKLNSKSEKKYLVGSCDKRDGFRVYFHTTDIVVLSRDVVIKEEEILSSNEAVKQRDH